MTDRSLVDIDDELSKAVKAREGATKMIRMWSDKVIESTSRVDRLLAERSDMVLASLTCPDTAEALASDAAPSPTVKGA